MNSPDEEDSSSGACSERLSPDATSKIRENGNLGPTKSCRRNGIDGLEPSTRLVASFLLLVVFNGNCAALFLLVR